MAYTYRVGLTVQASQVTGTLTDFPALISHTLAVWKSVAMWGARLWLGVRLLRLAAWAMGCGIEVKTFSVKDIT